MEACATSHFWGRFAQALGHDVRLIPPIYVKPFVKRQKNDAADAAAIAEAAVRPNLHYVAVKRAEFGLVVAQGPANLKSVVGMIDDSAIDLPDAVRDVARLYLDQIALLTKRIEELHSKLVHSTKVDDAMRRLCTVPGVGPVTAGAIMAFAPDLHTFASGRNFAAWLGLVPRDSDQPAAKRGSARSTKWGRPISASC